MLLVYKISQNDVVEVHGYRMSIGMSNTIINLNIAEYLRVF